MGSLSCYTAVHEKMAFRLLKMPEDDLEELLFELIWDKEELDEWDLELDKSALDLHQIFTGQRHGWQGGSYPFNQFFFGNRVICNMETYANLILPHEVRDIAACLENIGLEWFKNQCLDHGHWRIEQEERWRRQREKAPFWRLFLSKQKPAMREQIAARINYLFEYVGKMRLYFARCAANNMAVVFTTRP